MIVHIDRDRNKIAGSHRAIYPENDPWSGVWQLGIGDTLDAKVVCWIEHPVRCGDDGDGDGEFKIRVIRDIRGQSAFGPVDVAPKSQ